MALAFVLGATVYVVLDEENVARITKRDPFEFTPKQWSDLGPIPLPITLVIAYAPTTEYTALQAMTPSAIVNHLFRGYEFTKTDERRLADPPVRLDVKKQP